jgi:aromatic-L-amino-acid decarboxylase
MIRRHVAMTQELAGWVLEDPRFEIAVPHPLNLLCIRLVEGDEATDALIARANESGEALFTRTVLDGRVALRLSIGGSHTLRQHVAAGWELLQKLA